LTNRRFVKAALFPRSSLACFYWRPSVQEDAVPAEKIHRKASAKACFGNPPDSEWYKGIAERRYPAPDVALGPCTPGWTDGHIERHQKAMRDAAADGRKQRAEHGRALRKRVGKGATAVESNPTT
jgi:hypothetical protein